MWPSPIALGLGCCHSMPIPRLTDCPMKPASVAISRTRRIGVSPRIHAMARTEGISQTGSSAKNLAAHSGSKPGFVGALRKRNAATFRCSILAGTHVTDEKTKRSLAYNGRRARVYASRGYLCSRLRLPSLLRRVHHRDPSCLQLPLGPCRCWRRPSHRRPLRR